MRFGRELRAHERDVLLFGGLTAGMYQRFDVISGNVAKLMGAIGRSGVDDFGNILFRGVPLGAQTLE